MINGNFTTPQRNILLDIIFGFQKRWNEYLFYDGTENS